MMKKKEVKEPESIEERAKRYQDEIDAEQAILNGDEPHVQDAVIVEPHNNNGNGNNGNGHKKVDPIKDTVPVQINTTTAEQLAAEQRKIDSENAMKALERQQKLDREKDIPGIGTIVGPDDEKLKELTNLTGDQAFINSVIDMQDAIFANARNHDRKLHISLRQNLKNSNMRYSKSINGEGLVQVLKAMEYKTQQAQANNGLDLFKSRNPNG